MQPIKVKTRDGRDARIICVDRDNKGNDKFPVIALVRGGDDEFVCSYTLDGRAMIDQESDRDLILVQKRKGWINVYKPFASGDKNHGGTSVGYVYDTQLQARGCAGNSVIATVEIEYEPPILDLRKFARGDVEKAA